MATISNNLKAIQQVESELARLGVASYAAQLERLQEPLRPIQEMAERLRQLEEPLRPIREMAERMHQATEQHRKLFESLARPALDVSQSFAKLIEATRPDRSFVEMFAKASKDWQATFKAVEALKLQPLIPLDTHLAKLFEFSTLAERTLAGVRRDAFGVKLGLDAPLRAELVSRHEAFSSEYRTFFDGVTSTPSGVLELPKPLTELPAVEYLNEAAVVVASSEATVDAETAEDEKEVRTEQAAQASDELTRLVVELNQDLVGLLQGARAAFEARHPDYIRHFVTSYRELFGHVMRTLAPDDAVKAWTADKTHYDEKGRPTRRARVSYITRNLSPAFGGFMTADVAAALSFFDLTNKGTHELRSTFSQEQVNDLRVRMEGLIRLLLVASKLSA